jgi:hypothetical protein
MSRVLSGVALSLLFLSSVSAHADQYDDCVAGCAQSASVCTEQVRVTAGNVQEEEELIAACEKIRSDCQRGCSDAESQSPAPPQDPPPGNP